MSQRPKSPRSTSSVSPVSSGLRKLKVVVVGQYAVGKSSLIKQLTESAFSEGQVATIGVEFREKAIDDINLQIWDVAGQQRSSFLVTTYYRHALGAVIVADVTKQGAAYESETIQWRDDVVNKCSPPASYDVDGSTLPIFIVFNKIDLVPADDRPRVERYWRDFATTHGFKESSIFFTSARDHACVAELFAKVTATMRAIPTRVVASVPVSRVDLSGAGASPKQKKDCPC